MYGKFEIEMTQAGHALQATAAPLYGRKVGWRSNAEKVMRR